MTIEIIDWYYDLFRKQVKVTVTCNGYQHVVALPLEFSTAKLSVVKTLITAELYKKFYLSFTPGDVYTNLENVRWVVTEADE